MGPRSCPAPLRRETCHGDIPGLSASRSRCARPHCLWQRNPRAQLGVGRDRTAPAPPEPLLRTALAAIGPPMVQAQSPAIPANEMPPPMRLKWVPKGSEWAAIRPTNLKLVPLACGAGVAQRGAVAGSVAGRRAAALAGLGERAGIAVAGRVRGGVPTGRGQGAGCRGPACGNEGEVFPSGAPTVRRQLIPPGFAGFGRTPRDTSRPRSRRQSRSGLRAGPPGEGRASAWMGPSAGRRKARSGAPGRVRIASERLRERGRSAPGRC